MITICRKTISTKFLNLCDWLDLAIVRNKAVDFTWFTITIEKEPFEPRFWNILDKNNKASVILSWKLLLLIKKRVYYSYRYLQVLYVHLYPGRQVAVPCPLRVHMTNRKHIPLKDRVRWSLHRQTGHVNRRWEINWYPQRHFDEIFTRPIHLYCFLNYQLCWLIDSVAVPHDNCCFIGASRTNDRNFSRLSVTVVLYCVFLRVVIDTEICHGCIINFDFYSFQ